MLVRFIFIIVSHAVPTLSIRRGRQFRQTSCATNRNSRGNAYWYLRRHGCVLVARNSASPGIRGEINTVGYDGQKLAFVAVKARTVVELARSSQSSARPVSLTPEEAVNWEKRRNLSRGARQFLRARHIETAPCRFEVLAIETRPGQKPILRLHKGAFNATPAWAVVEYAVARTRRKFAGASQRSYHRTLGHYLH